MTSGIHSDDPEFCRKISDLLFKIPAAVTVAVEQDKRPAAAFLYIVQYHRHTFLVSYFTIYMKLCGMYFFKKIQNKSARSIDPMQPWEYTCIQVFDL